MLKPLIYLQKGYYWPRSLQRFLELKLSLKNCLNRFELLSSKEDGYARKCSWNHTYSKALLFIQMNFYSLSLSSYFYKSLSFQQFYRILSSDCLDCRYEDQVIIINLHYDLKDDKIKFL